MSRRLQNCFTRSLTIFRADTGQVSALGRARSASIRLNTRPKRVRVSAVCPAARPKTIDTTSGILYPREKRLRMLPSASPPLIYLPWGTIYARMEA